MHAYVLLIALQLYVFACISRRLVHALDVVGIHVEVTAPRVALRMRRLTLVPLDLHILNLFLSAFGFLGDILYIFIGFER